MKKVFYLAAAAMAVLSSCDKDNMLVENGTGSDSFNAPIFTATIEDHATKTSLGNAVKVNWETGDEVKMIFMNITDPESASMPVYTVTPGLDATTATLSIKDGEVYDETCNYLVTAVYPASSFTNTGYSFPATQTYAGDDKIPYAPMVFLNPMTEPIPANLQFQNAASLLKITVPYSQMHSVSSITVSSNLVMNGPVQYNSNGYFYINANDCEPVSDENSRLTLSCGSVEIPADGSKTFYISILPLSSEITYHVQAQCYDYLQIDVTDGTTTKSMRTNKAGGIQVQRNKIYPITFEENVAPAAWENALTLGKSSSGATSIVIETGIDVSSYEEDETHKSLNAAGTLWEVLDGQVLRIQTSATKIIAPVNSSYLLGRYLKVESITGLDKLDMSAVTDIKGMFWYCQELRSLNLSSFNTSNVTDMNRMFFNCYNLTEIIGIENLNTSNVTNMSGMFGGCSRLTALDISNFVTSNVENMSGMFTDCSGLTELNISNFVTSNVENMSCMFTSCSTLQGLDLSNFDTENVTDMSYMFADCQALQTLDLSSFKTENVTDMSGMFSECQALQTLDLSSFHTMNAPNMSYMFSMCTSLESLTLGDSFMPGSEMIDMFNGSGADSFLTVYGADPMFVEIVTNDPATGWYFRVMHFDGY